MPRRRCPRSTGSVAVAGELGPTRVPRVGDSSDVTGAPVTVMASGRRFVVGHRLGPNHANPILEPPGGMPIQDQLGDALGVPRRAEDFRLSFTTTPNSHRGKPLGSRSWAMPSSAPRRSPIPPAAPRGHTPASRCPVNGRFRRVAWPVNDQLVEGHAEEGGGVPKPRAAAT